MLISILQTEDQWASLADEWNALLKDSATDVPFLRHEYLWAWWQHRGGGEWPQDSRLHIITARGENDELIGIAPLFQTTNRDGVPVLLFLGSVEISDFLDFIVRESNLPAFIAEMLNYLAGPDAPEWHCLDLFNLLEESPSLTALQAAADARGLQFKQARLQPAPLITLPDNYDAFFEMLDGKDRQELRRKLRNAGGFFMPVTSYTVQDSETLDGEIDAMISLMVQDEDKAKFMTPAMDQQMRAIFRAAWEAGFLRLTFLTVGDQKAAGVVGFDYNNRIWGYNGGMDLKFERLAPGVVIMSMDLEDVIGRGYEAYDLMRGSEEYKYRFGAVDRWVIRATISRN